MSQLLHHQPTAADMQAALEATKLPPKEHFARMVRNGLINSEGKLTRLFGGDAEPESGAQSPNNGHTNGAH